MKEYSYNELPPKFKKHIEGYYAEIVKYQKSDLGGDRYYTIKVWVDIHNFWVGFNRTKALELTDEIKEELMPYIFGTEE